MLLAWAVQSVSSPRGQGLVEYSLILVLVAIVVIAALMMLGPVVGNTFTTINNSLGSLPNP
jgi:pilus assembly protein Flp/PilA